VKKMAKPECIDIETLSAYLDREAGLEARDR